MALLYQISLDQIAKRIQQYWSNARESCNFLKTELATAVNAADAWADANAASYNTALPAGFRSRATTAQKSLLLVYVICRRAGMQTIDVSDD